MSEELQEIENGNSDRYKNLLLPDVKQFIKSNMESASRSFVAIGYYLKYIRDNQLYKEDGYNGVSEFAKAEFGISPAQASKFISINDKFSMDGNSPVLLDQYKDFSSSKLSEMLYLTDEQLDQVSITTTVAEIREIKEPEKDESFSTSKTESAKPVTIDDLDFTVRTYNCLKRAGIDAIDEICDLTEDEVIKIRNISRKCIDEINEKLSEIGRSLKSELSKNCIHRPEFPCTLSEAQKVAHGDGIDCNKKCCWGCSDHGKCGYECNASAYRLKVNDIPETVNDDPETVNDELEIVNDVDESDEFNLSKSDLPCDTCGWDVKGCCDYNNEDMHCIDGDAWRPKETDPVEIVEADIIQTEPEETFTDQCEAGGLKFNNWLKTNNFSIAQIVSDVLCKIPLASDNDPFLSSKVTNGLISSLLIKTDAYYSYLTKELNIKTEKPKQTQPELPILRNNDQRKEFIEAYETWPVWINQELTGERYYRYDFDNEDSVVVKVYYCKIFDYKSVNLVYEERFRDDWGKEEYYLLGPDKYFKDCETNKSALVDYLKDLQKKGI